MGAEGKVVLAGGLRHKGGHAFFLCSNTPAGGMPQATRLKIARNQLLHDVIGSPIDPLYPRICPHLGNGIFLHKPIAAMKLQAVI